MSQQAHPGTAGGPGPISGQPEARTRTLWVGWIWFGGAMMILLGIFGVIQGLVALFNDKYYVVGPEGLLVFDLTGWGWVHLILGALAIVAGFALFSGATWARVTAVVLATINAVAQLAFLSAYPVWGTICIALDVLVIWAVIVHGKEVQSDRW
ncbi:hypothetical protein FPZ12_008855 [Amycolatopsis acidicola]|uniref:DUF7144 domain-containing protein n=1 Tax=Amycolatopsis acidicola TaxID=2596893 RepID=A0A5N0VB43_9PSEU|nr:hypothetical protein [Amycolatopsis acidicola]KAA9163607.1 hypothetical protein FPZ12_008855 [Amycolatopsis acidicola]